MICIFTSSSELPSRCPGLRGQGLQSLRSGPAVPSGEGDPCTRMERARPAPGLINSSTVDILLLFSRDWWEAQEVGGRCVCQYYDKV